MLQTWAAKLDITNATVSAAAVTAAYSAVRTGCLLG
jgi:hypothetical protein